MLSIYDVETAKKTILKRTPLSNVTYPSATLARTGQLFGKGITPPQAVTLILASVRLEGDAALRRWCQLLERTLPETFRVPPEKLERAYRSLPADLLAAMQTAAGRIRRFHEFQPLPNWETGEMGGRLGQRVTAIERVGVYVPGGTAPLPSSLLMSVIPAQVAGVRTIIVCTPPEPHPVILAAAYMCGVDQVYQLGGAQAIAALTFGTESVPKVDKIVGAGNLFVTLAKQQVYGTVGLDGLAGPTETVVVADASANPAWVAADLLAQAEHDALASAILLTPERFLAEAVQMEVARQMENLSRSEIIAQSLAERSGIVLTPDLETACALANEYAAEHTCLAVADPQKMAALIPNAGGLFLGEHSFEVLGDYVAGPSHVMPTGGTARFASPLNVMDFVKISSIIALDDASGRELSQLAAVIARAEGLTAHAAAADFRALSPLPAPFGGASRGEGRGEGESMFNPATLIRPHIQDMPVYEPILPFEVLSRQLGRSPEQIIKLDANENPYGISPAARRTLAGMGFPHIYPDPESRALRAALSRFTGVPAENLLAGSGADELIDLITRLMLEPGDRVVNCPPTFGMYPFDTGLNAGRVVDVPRHPDFSLDLDGIRLAVEKSHPKLLFLTSPNNPDGSLIPSDMLTELLSLPVLIVLDEAYIEFADENNTLGKSLSNITRVPELENLIVLRTFSKWAGLAGLRLGYGAFPAWLMPTLWKAKQPYNVNVAASEAGIASINDADYITKIVARLRAEREQLMDGLNYIPYLRTYPTFSNFILCRVSGREAARLKADLAEKYGILVRYFNKPGLRDCIRISVGKPEHTNALLAALRELPAGK